MPKAPEMSDAPPGSIEHDAEKAAAAAIEEAVPPELQEHAESALQMVLQSAQKSPIVALLLAAAIGFLAAMLFSK